MRRIVWMVLAAGLLAGCTSVTPETDNWAAGPAGDLRTTMDVECSYAAACRAVVKELRRAVGDPAVIHEIWPDIEQGGVLVTSPTRGGRVVVVTTSAIGPNRCRVEIFVDHYWRGRTYPAIQRALTSPAAPAKR